MVQYIAGRFQQLILVLFGISTVLFFLLRLSGDPVVLLVPEDAGEDVREAVRRSYGLDQPWWVQYGIFLRRALVLDFGYSYRYDSPALSLVLDRLPATAQLALAAILVALIVAIPIGVAAAVRPGSVASSLMMVAALFGQSMPVFWLGILLILVFAVSLRWLPSFGNEGPLYLILPAATLGLVIMAKIARLMRSGMLEVLEQDYVRTAYAKGLSTRSVVWGHAVRNALIAVVTIVGLELSHLLGGAVITETIFAWPGLGRQLIQAVQVRDYPLIQASVFVVALSVVLTNFAVDGLYRLLDPRIRED
jgi:peptide/nickel transport system permease protein